MKASPLKVIGSIIGTNIVIFAILFALITGTSCDKRSIPTSIPANAVKVDSSVSIYPDYSDVTIPLNIAPMNFEILEDGEEFIVRIAAEGAEEILCGGNPIDIPEKQWKTLLAAAQGKKIAFDIFVRTGTDWKQFKTIENTVSSDPIDSWLMYRLIEPGYEFFNNITLNQRNLSTFSEEPFAKNLLISDQMCMNCHSFQNRKTDRMLFHTRNYRTGTVLVENGTARKVDLKPEGLFSNCTYPSWHPDQNLVAFSVNKTFQAFHALSPNRIEVMDSYSDLVCFDPERNEILWLLNTPNDFETFPNWSQDGNHLYFCSAKFETPTEKNLTIDENPSGSEGKPLDNETARNAKKHFYDHYREFKYDLMRMSFDRKTRKFGKPEKVIDAAALNKSIVHPRVSPDNRWLMFTMSAYGTFPIWHRDSDLFLLDLQTGKHRRLDEINSGESESYHTWDSSGKWFVFSSRREDGNYTRLYFAHFENGKADKPFLLPQKNPDQNRQRMKSYNVPELVTEPIAVSLKDIITAAKNAAPEPTVLQMSEQEKKQEK